MTLHSVTISRHLTDQSLHYFLCRTLSEEQLTPFLRSPNWDRTPISRFKRSSTEPPQWPNISIKYWTYFWYDPTRDRIPFLPHPKRAFWTTAAFPMQRLGNKVTFPALQYSCQVLDIWTCWKWSKIIHIILSFSGWYAVNLINPIPLAQRSWRWGY